MQIIEVDKENYKEIVKPRIAFNGACFNYLNASKVDSIKYLLFKENKYRFALCVGIRRNEILCPFSAPFGSLEPLRPFTSVEMYDKSLESLEQYLSRQKYASMEFTLPPSIYDEDNSNIIANVLYRRGYTIKNVDLNYSFSLKDILPEHFAVSLPRNGRKNLAIALNSNLSMVKGQSLDDLSLAYEIIQRNRESRGYPLRMSLQDLARTIKIIKCDSFIVYKDKMAIASAIVYQTTDSVAQVIYWGDIPSCSELKAINYLSYQLINFYKDLGFKYLDVGPSTENSIPNYGLCDFKTSIGCNINTKISMIKRFTY